VTITTYINGTLVERDMRATPYVLSAVLRFWSLVLEEDRAKTTVRIIVGD
jgi:hypothetical protein